MHWTDLNHQDLLSLDPDAGTISFAGQRAVIMDAIAMGMLRHYLVQNFGVVAARTVLTQFGFAHGYRMAEAMKSEFSWASKQEWRNAGPILCMLEGFFSFQEGFFDPLSEKGAVLLASFEAEQHLLHFGQGQECTCWTIGGLLSGYITYCQGEEIYVLENKCLGAGHSACHFVGQNKKDWGKDREKDLSFFQQDKIDESLNVSLKRVIKKLQNMEKNRAVNPKEPDTSTYFNLGWLTQSKAMQKVVELATRIAKVDAAVLITGESGVGKERVARFIHEQSPRSKGPFIAINCGAITETLLESELFGHSRGAFTGATSDRPGLFEAANSGTLLLDEIGEISGGMQVKLLRVLQEKEIRRVGENRSRPVNVRILASTNLNLPEAIAKGDFRNDLYYRLKVVEIQVPALRQRREDILTLSKTLLNLACKKMGRQIKGFSRIVMDRLLRYEWPGNVRELENTMERAVALCRGERIELEDLPDELNQMMKPVLNQAHVQTLQDFEKDYILAVMALNKGNKAQTANMLNIGSATLYRKLKSYES